MKRISYIDIFRGFGILLMIGGHIAGFDNWFDHWIHAFHMPMFFFISGFLFNGVSRNSSLVVKKNLKTLILPYVVFGISHYLLFWLFIRKDISLLKNLFFVNTDGVAIAGALWFLTALFFVNILYNALNRFITNKIILGIVICIIALIGNFAEVIFPFTLPWAISPALVGLGLYHIGYNIKEYTKIDKGKLIFKLRTNQILLLLTINTTLIMLNGYINMRTATYGNVLLFWINSVLAIIIVLNVCSLLEKSSEKHPEYLKFLIDHCKYIGQNSIVYLCLNQIFILIYKRGFEFIASRFLDCQYNFGIVGGLVVTCFTLLSLYVASCALTRTPLKIIIGK